MVMYIFANRLFSAPIAQRYDFLFIKKNVLSCDVHSMLNFNCKYAYLFKDRSRMKFKFIFRAWTLCVLTLICWGSTGGKVWAAPRITYGVISEAKEVKVKGIGQRHGVGKRHRSDMV